MIRGPKKTLKSHMGSGEQPVVRLPRGEEEVTLTIDGREVTVPKGTKILTAALHAGIKVPYFCYHPGLSPEGNCRMCLVEIEGSRKLEPSCTMPVREGMSVRTDTGEVEEARRGVMEFLLLNHPLDCPWCDKAGECMLQDNSFDHGPGIARHEVIKRTYPTKDFSDRLKMYMNRCIHCTRCVRFLREIEGGEEFSLYQRGAYVDVGTYIEHNLSSNYQGCLADVCPVGALVTKPFLYRARVFDLEAQSSVCTMCSAGCSIYVDRKQNRAVRLRPRPNLDVNDWWMCDIGRFEFEWAETDRLDEPMKEAGGAAEGEKVVITWEEALSTAASALERAGEKGTLGGIVSAAASCEETWLFRRLMEGLGGRFAPWYTDEGRIDPAEKTDFLHRQDPNPNTLGMEAALGGWEDLEDLVHAVETGVVTTLFLLGAVLTDELAARLSSAEEVIVLSSHHTPAARAATLALPGAVWLEKEGTFVNGDGHLQRFLKALDIETSAQPEAAVLSTLLERTGTGGPYEDTEEAFAELARGAEAFEGLNYADIPPNGYRLSSGVPGLDGQPDHPGDDVNSSAEPGS
ncbi:MAG: 2Fe-2S iron-sulfur cluster-binding protein [bacterium]